MKKSLTALIIVLSGISLYGSGSNLESDSKKEKIKKNREVIKELKRLKPSDYKEFKYSETVLSEKVRRIWRLNCKVLNCEIVYERRDIPNSKDYFYNRTVVLSSEKEKEKIVKKLAEGIQNLKEATVVTTDVQWESVLIPGNGKAYYGNAQNREFYLMLDKLIGENYEEIEEKIEKRINGGELE